MGKQFFELPWAYEAREFLRKRCIGKTVNASVDFIQPKSDKFEEKICATVTIDGKYVFFLHKIDILNL